MREGGLYQEGHQVRCWGSPPPRRVGEWKGCGERGASHNSSHTPSPPWGEGGQEAVWQGREGPGHFPVPKAGSLAGCGQGAAQGLCALGGASQF